MSAVQTFFMAPQITIEKDCGRVEVEAMKLVNSSERMCMELFFRLFWIDESPPPKFVILF